MPCFEPSCNYVFVCYFLFLVLHKLFGPPACEYFQIPLPFLLARFSRMEGENIDLVWGLSYLILRILSQQGCPAEGLWVELKSWVVEYTRHLVFMQKCLDILAAALASFLQGRTQQYLWEATIWSNVHLIIRDELFCEKLYVQITHWMWIFWLRPYLCRHMT